MRNTPCRPRRGGFGARPGVRAPGDGLTRVAGSYWPPRCCCWPTGGGAQGPSILRAAGRWRSPRARRWPLRGGPWPAGWLPVPVGGAAAAGARIYFLSADDHVIIPSKTASKLLTMACEAPACPRDTAGTARRFERLRGLVGARPLPTHEQADGPRSSTGRASPKSTRTGASAAELGDAGPSSDSLSLGI